MTFRNTATVSVTPYSLGRNVCGAISRLRDTDRIEDFMSKPISLGVGTLSTGIGAHAIIDVTAATLGSYAMWNEKKRGFLGFRATAVIRVEITASPFAAGRLRLAYLPHSSRHVNFVDADFTQERVAQLPGVDLDFSQANSAELRMPYIAAEPYFDIVRGLGEWGKVVVYRYLPLAKVAATSSPIVRIYLHFEDVEFVHSTAYTDAEVTIDAQMGAEKEQQQNKPISTLLSATANASDFFGNKFPLISSYTKVVSWVARAGAKVAAAFGWSKPLPDMAIQRAYNTYASGNANCTGVDMADNLGILHDSKINALPGFAGSDIDEMSIDYVCSKPGLVKTGNISDQTQGTCFFATKLCPDNMWYQGSSNKPTQALVGAVKEALFDWESKVVMTPVCAVSQLFAKWRGDFVITLKFAKTAYHTGRILAVYQPGNTQTSRNVSTVTRTVAYINAQYCHRQLIDLRDGADFTFVIPYKDIKPWCEHGEFSGVFSLWIAEPLGYNESVTSSIPFCIEVAASNAQFCQPVSTCWLPTDTQQMPVAEMGIESQSGVITMMEEDPSDPLTLAQYTCGEAVHSLKQLGMRTDLSNDAGWTTAPTSSDKQLALIDLFKQNNANVFWDGSAYDVDRNNVDTLDYIRSFFTLERGSFVLRAQTLSTGPKITVYTAPGAVDTVADTRVHGLAQITATGTSQVSANVPMYPASYSTYIKSGTSDQFNTKPRVLISVADVSGGRKFRWGRCFGDDYQAGLFTGIPPMYYCRDPSNTVDYV